MNRLKESWQKFRDIETNFFFGKKNQEVDEETQNSLALQNERKVSEMEQYRILDTSDIPPEEIKNKLVQAILQSPPPSDCARVNVVVSNTDGWIATGIMKWKKEGDTCVQRETHLIRFKKNEKSQVEGFSSLFYNDKFILIFLILFLLFVWQRS